MDTRPPCGAISASAILSSSELRSTIQAATNKSESFNDFVKWLAFGGGGVIAENDRGEQRKIIKYNHLLCVPRVSGSTPMLLPL